MSNIILTESSNPNTFNIDLLNSYDILKLINDEDKKVAIAVERELLNISLAVDLITDKLNMGGSLLYFGAGTSGRLGVLDASECPPTFGVSPDLVRGYIAGTDIALRKAVEGAEDIFEDGCCDLVTSLANKNDVVVGLSASGGAPYVCGVLSKAIELGISTVAVTCNKKAKIASIADIHIAPEVGPEVVTGSTRLKAGTAQKMVLNMLTSASMIKIGKTYENYMIDVKPTNEKLKDRAIRIVSELANVDYEKARETLLNNNYDVKISTVMLKKNINSEEAKKLLEKNKGILRKIVIM